MKSKFRVNDNIHIIHFVLNKKAIKNSIPKIIKLIKILLREPNDDDETAN